MKKYSLLLTGCIFAFVSHVIASDEPKYMYIEEYCVETNQDTFENCKCGQATADKIMSSEEQALALRLMVEDSEKPPHLGDKHDEFMAKLSQVRKGCG